MTQFCFRRFFYRQKDAFVLLIIDDYDVLTLRADYESLFL